MDNRKIVVYNNKVVINNYEYGDYPGLDSSFEVFDKVTHMYRTVAAIYDRKNKTLTIPRGIDIPYLERMLDYNAFYDNTYIQPRSNLDKILIKYPPKDEKQAQAINFLSGTGNYSYTKKYSQLFLALDTGAGKTYLGIVYTALLNLKTIIITTSNDWLSQWRTRFIEHTNMMSSEIHSIDGSMDINNILDKPDSVYDKYKLYTVTHATLLSYANEHGWESIDYLFRKLGIGLKIIDEAHLNFDNIYHIDYASSVYRTLYLTATPVRGESNENRIYQIYFKNIPMLDLFDPENDPHTHYISLRYNSGFTISEINMCQSKYGFNKQKYSEIVVMKENFDFISRIVMDMVYHIPGKKMFFFATNNAIIFFYNWLLYNYSEIQNDIGIFTSINENKSAAKDKTYILTTSKSAGAAIDIPDLMVCVNMAEPTKSPPQNKQRFGRTRAYNSYYIDVVDTSLKVINNYYKQSYSMFEKYALDMKDVVFTQTQLRNTAFNIMYKRLKEFGGLPFENLDPNSPPKMW
jgi:hypothetical protein